MSRREGVRFALLLMLFALLVLLLAVGVANAQEIITREQSPVAGTPCDPRTVTKQLVDDRDAGYYCDDSVSPALWRLETKNGKLNLAHFLDGLGLDADGVDDTYDAWVQAIGQLDEPGVLVVPDGDYLMGTSLQIDRGNITILCGNRARLIAGGPGVFLMRFNGPMENVHVQGCTFYDPDPLNNSQNTCSVAATACASVADCPAHETCDSFAEETHGIVANQVNNFWAEGVRAFSVGDESIDLQKCTNARITDFYAESGCSGSAGGGVVTINNTVGVEIDGAIIKDTVQGTAIHMEATTTPGNTWGDVRISNCHIDTSGGDGINATAGMGASGPLTITGCLIEDVDLIPINIVPASSYNIEQVIVSNNTILNGGDEATNGFCSITTGSTCGIDIDCPSGETCDESPALVRGALSFNEKVFDVIATNNIIDGWGKSVTANHFGIRFAESGNQARNNIIDVTGQGKGGIVSQAKTDGLGNIIQGNTIRFDKIGIAAQGGLDTVTGNTIIGTNDAEGKCIQVESWTTINNRARALVSDNNMSACGNRGIGIKDSTVAKGNFIRGSEANPIATGIQLTGGHPRCETSHLKCDDTNQCGNTDGTCSASVCSGGWNDGNACSVEADCDPGDCDTVTTLKCIAGPSIGDTCAVDADCENGTCLEFPAPVSDRNFFEFVTSEHDGWLTADPNTIYRTTRKWKSIGRDPGPDDNADEGYVVGSRWINTTQTEEYVLVGFDDATGDAFWEQTTAEASVAGDRVIVGSDPVITLLLEQVVHGG